MYEEYLEDYVYKLMAKIASRICRMIKFKNINTTNKSSTSLILKSNDSTIQENLIALEDRSITNKQSDKPEPSDAHIKKDSEQKYDTNEKDKKDSEQKCDTNEKDKKDSEQKCDTNEKDKKDPEQKCDTNEKDKKDEIDEDLNNLNFHLMLFFMWITVTVVNIPALLTWAKNFKYSMVLKPDTSYHTGLVMSACSTFTWQMNGPRINLKYYEAVSALIFTMAVFIIVLGPLSLTIVNYGVTFMFLVITTQQIFDKEDNVLTCVSGEPENTSKTEESESDIQYSCKESDETNMHEETTNTENTECNEEVDNSKSPNDDCDVCSESRIYTIFRNLREKISFSNENS